MLTLSENFEKSWRFLLRLFEDIGRTALLIILQIIPIVNFIVLGYGYEIIRLGESIDEPPPLENLGELFIKGLKLFVIALVYFIIPLAVVILILGSFRVFPILWSIYATGGLPSLLIFSGIFLIAYIASFIVGLAVAIFAFMGIIHAIKTGELSKAFTFEEIMDLINRVGWDMYLLWAIIMYIAMYFIVSISSWIIQSILMALFIVFFARSANYVYPITEPVEEPKEHE